MAERLIVSPEYAMQEKIDGVRLTVLINEDGIFGYNKRGEQASLAPWLHKELSMLPEQPWTFDGEFTGNAYHIFNLLEAPRGAADGPFKERMGKLTMIVDHWMEGSKPQRIHVVPAHTDPKDKLRLLVALSVADAEGAVFRPQNESSHFQGRIYKYKFRNTVDAVVLNTTSGKSSIEMGLYRDNELVPIGKCAIHSPIQPGTIVEMMYRKVSANNRLVEPVFVRMRTDKPEYQCTWDQLIAGKHLQDQALIDYQAATIGEALGLGAEELHKFTTSLGD